MDRGTCILSVMLAYLKSGYDPHGFDPGGQKRRAAEVKALIAIYQKLKTEKANDHPGIVAGDFNGNASRAGTSAEFLPLYETTDLENVLFLAGIPRYKCHNADGGGEQKASVESAALKSCEQRVKRLDK